MRTAPASEDGVQLGSMKRPCVLTVRIAREPAETSGAVEEPGRRQAATRLADDERRDERTVRRLRVAVGLVSVNMMSAVLV